MLDWEKPRSVWISGSATLTTVTSRTIISMPTHSTINAAQRLRSGTAAACGGWVWVVVSLIGDVSFLASFRVSTYSSNGEPLDRHPGRRNFGGSPLRPRCLDGDHPGRPRRMRKLIGR